MNERRPLQELRLALGLAAVAAAWTACASRPAPAPERRERPPAAARGPVRAPATWDVYVVQPGDTLAKIAACRAASVDQLARANGIRNPDFVMVGERLRVPVEDRCAGAGIQMGRAAAPAATAPGGPTPAVGTEPPAAPRDSLDPESPELPDDPAARARAKLAAAQADYDAARFEEALAGAQDAADEIGDPAGGEQLAALRARCYLLAGMAAAALDERERALALFGAAFALDPDISLAREQTSPRILELVDQAAGSTAGSPAPPEPR